LTAFKDRIIRTDRRRGGGGEGEGGRRGRRERGKKRRYGKNSAICKPQGSQ
jgi:hypothetical protein